MTVFPLVNDLSTLASLLGAEVGVGATLGFLIGYGIKKIAALILKLTAFVLGMFLLALTYLNATGIISINFQALEQTVGNALTGIALGAANSLLVLGQVLPLGGSFALGFYFGAKKG